MACGLRHLLALCRKTPWQGILRFQGTKQEISPTEPDRHRASEKLTNSANRKPVENNMSRKHNQAQELAEVVRLNLGEINRLVDGRAPRKSGISNLCSCGRMTVKPEVDMV